MRNYELYTMTRMLKYCSFSSRRIIKNAFNSKLKINNEEGGDDGGTVIIVTMTMPLKRRR
jgi:hypothetical protein